MAYTFEITSIAKLPRARIGVLDGKLLEGSVTTDSVASLVHGKERVPMHVKGVVLDSAKKFNNALSITVELRQHAMDIVSVGDRLVCA
jgi:hypothetical protein